MEMKKQTDLYLQGSLSIRLSYLVVVSLLIATLYPTVSLSEYTDPCKSSPCLNDGRCNEIEDGVEVGAYLCYCTPGWEGKNCHIRKENVECSNTSVCVKGEFCNFDFYESGFCESCPHSGTVVDNMCEAQDFLFELGTEDCKKRCVSDDKQIVSSRSSVLVISIISVVVGIFVFIVILVSTLYYINKIDQPVSQSLPINPLKSIAWKENELYESKQSLAKSEAPSSWPEWLKDKREMVFLKNSIVKGKLLGKGQFGNVYKGKLHQGNAVFPIAIKCAQNIGPEKTSLFLDEAKTMLQIGSYHDFIVNLQGIIYNMSHGDDHAPEVALLLEYCSKGDLKSYMIRNRKDFERSLHELHLTRKIDDNDSQSKCSHDVKLLYRWTYQIADGMDFLTEKNIYHGDLAARNVLLTDAYDAKISDFGLSRRLYSDLKTPHALRMKNEKMSMPLPIKWIAIELLTRHEFIPIKSDVWSFGVTMWEIFSTGREPYRVGIDIDSLIYDLSFGVRLPAPKFCPQSISYLLKKCFVTEPDQRPDFKIIKAFLEDAYRLLFNKKQSAEKHCDGSQLPKQPLSELQGETMKNRYVAVLKGNQNCENSHHGRAEKEAPVEKNSEDFGSVQYTVVKQLPKSDIKPLANIDENLSEEHSSVTETKDVDKDNKKPLNIEEEECSVQYTTVEILPKSKNQYSSFTNEEHSKDENEPKDQQVIQDVMLLRTKDEEIFSLQYKTLSSSSPKSLSDSTIYINQISKSLMQIERKFPSDTKVLAKDLMTLGVTQQKKQHPNIRKGIEDFDTLPKRYQNEKITSSYSLV